MKRWELLRQEAEWLVDLLEEKPDEPVHICTRKELAAELRAVFGMVTYEMEQDLKKFRETLKP